MSENQDESQKTEEPTPRKLEEARKKGQVSNSRVTSFAILLGGGDGGGQPVVDSTRS